MNGSQTELCKVLKACFERNDTFFHLRCGLISCLLAPSIPIIATGSPAFNSSSYKTLPGPRTPGTPSRISAQTSLWSSGPVPFHNKRCTNCVLYRIPQNCRRRNDILQWRFFINVNLRITFTTTKENIFRIEVRRKLLADFPPKPKLDAHKNPGVYCRSALESWPQPMSSRWYKRSTKMRQENSNLCHVCPRPRYLQ